MIKTTVYLPRELKRALAKAARAQRRSEADLLRQAVEVLTREATAPAPSLSPAAAG